MYLLRLGIVFLYQYLYLQNYLTAALHLSHLFAQPCKQVNYVITTHQCFIPA